MTSGRKGRVPGLGPVVHDHQRDPVVRGEPDERLVVADPPDVVDQVGAGGQGGLGDGRLRGVDAERRVGQGRPQAGDDRHDPAALLVGRHGVVSRARRFATDVEQVGALVDHPPAGFDGRLDRVDGADSGSGPGQQPIAGEGIGGHVEDPHHEGPLAPAEGGRADA